MMQTVPLSIIDEAITIWLGLSLVSGFSLIRANDRNTETIFEFAK